MADKASKLRFLGLELEYDRHQRIISWQRHIPVLLPLE